MGLYGTVGQMHTFCGGNIFLLKIFIMFLIAGVSIKLLKIKPVSRFVSAILISGVK